MLTSSSVLHLFPTRGVLPMLKLTAGVLAIVLAGSASAAGWRSLRIDASSEQAFNESVGVFREKLPYVRHYVFVRSRNLQARWPTHPP
jgi:hypothetical protein